MDIYIVKHPGHCFTGCRAQNPAKILNNPTAEAYGGSKKQGRQIPAVKTFADKLAGGNDDVGLALIQSLDDIPAFVHRQVTG